MSGGAAYFVVGCPQKHRVADARNFDGILKREKHALLCALLGSKRQQIFTKVGDFAFSDFVSRMSRQHLRERAFARTIRTHDGVNFSRLH